MAKEPKPLYVVRGAERDELASFVKQSTLLNAQFVALVEMIAKREGVHAPDVRFNIQKMAFVKAGKDG